MDKQLQGILIDSGFTDKEAAVYLALLELGDGSVTEIGLKSGLKRSIIYVILEGLIKRGYATELTDSKIGRFVAADPLKILSNIETVAINFKQMMPILKGIHNTSKLKPKVEYFEGKEAVLSIYRHINYTTGSMFFTSMTELARHIPAEIDVWVSGIRNKAYVKNARHIFPDLEFDVKHGKMIDGQNGNEVRVLDSKMNMIEMDLSLYSGNKICLSSITDNFYAFVIESGPLYNSLKTMFELAWTQGKPVKLVD